MSLKAIIVEDEEVSRTLLRTYLEKYCPKVEVKGEAANIEQALELIRKEDLDLVFLDVEMPFGNAFDLLDRVGNRTFETIFVTAYDHYAVEALNQHASYYLLKPISIDDLIQAVDYVVSIKEKEDSLGSGIALSQKFGPTDKITIPTQEGFEVLTVSDIVYCQADDNYTKIHLTDSVKLVSKTLKHFEDMLSGMGFVRIHKSHMVNIQEVVGYNKGKGGTVKLRSGKELQVSANKKAVLLEYFK